MIHLGEGVAAPNLEAAARLYQWAVDRGFAHAQHNLAHMLEQGIGIEMNLVEAHAWYTLAAVQAGDELPELRHLAQAGRARVAKRLSVSELDEAKEITAAWRQLPPARISMTFIGDTRVSI